jgi:hypothetical protein
MSKPTYPARPVEQPVGPDAVLAALRVLYDRGHRRIRASTLAETLWPEGRGHNSNGQVFPLSAGVAGRMLRKCRAVWEAEPRIWEIIPERLP